jgi:drug/metabolite transporter (DMT)-like permease
MSLRGKDTNKALDPAGLGHLLVVYIVWSSTYLAIRLAVREGAGFPPFTLGYLRALPAGLILLAWGWLRHQRLRISWREAGLLAFSGTLLWLGGNGLVTFAEQRAESGLAALVVAATPIWTAIIDAILDREWPSWQLTAALLVGFSGIGVLTLPQISSGMEADVIAMAALIAASVLWAIGSVAQARLPVDLSARVSAGYQMVFGAAGFILVAALMAEPAPAPTNEAWLAYAYLVLVGSVLAFTSYVTALRVLPTRIVMTYAYINPVLAVLLGWMVLGEKITIWTMGGSLLVLVGVAGVFRERRLKQAPPP